MDGDPGVVDVQKDILNLVLPLPFRVGIVFVLGIWGWATNLHALHAAGVNVPALIRHPERTSSLEPPHHTATYRLARILTLYSAVFVWFFWLVTHMDAANVIRHDWIPMIYLVGLFLLFTYPTPGYSYMGRRRFLQTLRRIAIGGIAEGKDGKFCDILLADALTSCARVLGDAYVVFYMFYTSSATRRPDRHSGGAFAVPLVLSIPQLIRFRQCWIEYRRAKEMVVAREPHAAVPGSVHLAQKRARQNLANAAKYASAFPVLILGALLRTASEENRGMLKLLWILSALFNTLYSFYWDVANDWDLTLFSTNPTQTVVLGTGTEYHEKARPAYGLRSQLVFGRPWIYQVAILTDLVLRLTWAMKLSSYFGHTVDWETTIFVLELMEAGRRWMWMFFRIEAEHLRCASPGLDASDILWGEYDRVQEDE